ncbi:MAG: MarR family transcriptional regulator, partial [Desulfofustis sp.]|nr:MarR family transcriptional regulator [Desulfofustis sp.]
LGLVMRHPHPGDRRAVLVKLTQAGSNLEAVLTPLAMGLRQQINAELAPGEYEQLCHLLTRLKGPSDD